jgi:hypothetical protein
MLKQQMSLQHFIRCCTCGSYLLLIIYTNTKIKIELRRKH